MAILVYALLRGDKKEVLIFWGSGLAREDFTEQALP